LLDEAGLKDPDGDGPLPRFQIEYKTSNSSDATDLAQAIKNQLRAVGIEIKVRMYEWGTFYSDLKKGNFQIASGRLVGITDPDIYFDIFSSARFAPDGRNRGFYKNRELDSLLEQGRSTTNFSKRKIIYDRAQEIIADELPMFSLWHMNNIAAYRKGISGYEMYPNGSFRFLINVNK
jgi:peptide/nickel transport system substrate-binding protein